MNYLFNNLKMFIGGFLVLWIIVFSLLNRLSSDRHVVDGNKDIYMSDLEEIQPFGRALGVKNSKGQLDRLQRALNRKNLLRGKKQGARIGKLHPGGRKIKQRVIKTIEGKLNLAHNNEKILKKAVAESLLKKKGKPGKGQGETKKKKKIKKKAAVKKAAPPADEEEFEELADTDEEDSNDDESNDIGPPPIVFPAVVKTGNEIAENNSYEFWAQKLLDNPNFESLTDLIRAYQTNQVASEVFFELVEAMIEDGRSEYMHLAVIAAGSTPSTQSFEILARIMKTQAQGSPLRSEIETKMTYYKSLNNVGDLGQVLRSSQDSFTILIAMKVLEDSAATYLTNTSNQQPDQQPSGTEDEIAGEEPVDSNVALGIQRKRVYKSFLSILASLAVGNSDPEVAKGAQNVHQLLSQLTS